MSYPSFPTHARTDAETMNAQDRFPIDLANWMSVLLIIGPLLFSLVVMYAGQPGRLAVTAPFMLVGLAGLALRRTQRPKILFSALAIGSWLCALNALLWTNGTSGAAAAVLILALTSAGWVMSLPTTLLLTAATSLALYVVAFFEPSGSLQSIGWPASPYERALTYSIAAFGGATLGYFFGAGNRYRIGELQQSERALRASLAELQTRDAALRRSESQIADILDNTPTVVIVKDLEGRYLRVNRRYEELFHVARDGAIGKTDYDIFSADFAKPLQEADRLALESGKPIEVEERVPHDDGVHVYLCVKFPLSGSDGKPYAVCGIATDITERKRAEQELRDWRERVRAAERITGLGTWYIELPAERVRWSEGQYELFGVDPKDFVPSWTSFIDFVHPEDRAALKESIQRLHRDRKPAQVEFRIVRPDGEVRHLQSGATLICDPSGKPMELIGASLDVTAVRLAEVQRKRAEEGLRLHEERLRLAMEATHQGWFDLNIQSGEVTVSPEYARILGYEPEQFKSSLQGWIEGIHAEDRGAVLEAYRECLATGKSGQMEYRGLTKAGEWKWIRSTGKVVEFDAGGKPLRMSGTHADISVHKRAEELLRKSEARFMTVFHACPLPINISSLETGRLIDVNPAFTRLFGHSAQEACGRTTLELGIWVDAEDRAKFVRAMKNRAAVQGYEARGRLKSGEVRNMALYTDMIEYAQESCMLTLSVDITERKRLEEARLSSQKLESLGTLAGGIAHDFNNLLLVINGNAKLALEDLEAEHQARASLAAIAKAGARASELVRRILTFSRAEAERREVLQLRPVLEEGLKLLRSTLPAGIEFRSHFGYEVPLVAANATQLHEAVFNLAGNAVHAIGARAGVIDFALDPVEVDAEHAAKVAGLRPGRYARLSVTDDGCGMDGAILGRIFDAFYTTKPVGEGTGLGLSIVHGIMKGHGGAIEVKSAPGKGSSFLLYFPACEQKSMDEASARPPEAAPTAGKRVLYVDDEQDLIVLMERVLSRQGHSVCAYADAQQALREFALRPNEFDVVVTDLSMPRISGFELAREVRSIRPDIPVVMTSGYVRPEDEQRARAEGIRDLILKPLVLDELGAVLDRLFREGSSRSVRQAG